MPGRLEDKVAIITGGGSGIGRACALRFAAEGARVCVADLHQEAAAETARLAGGRTLALQVDTTSEEANQAMVARCVEALGTVDVLVAAAGIGSPRPSADSARPYSTLDIPIDRFRAVFDVNLYDRSRWAKELTPLGRYGSPEEVASTALFLASDDAAFFTGEILHPSGGVFVG
jgi:NAD(P)-dependent dehydrogenase (short-subunit alcohol dehydrogenase family)